VPIQVDLNVLTFAIIEFVFVQVYVLVMLIKIFDQYFHKNLILNKKIVNAK